LARWFLEGFAGGPSQSATGGDCVEFADVAAGGGSFLGFNSFGLTELNQTLTLSFARS
jgi:hypothetical protein